MNAQKMICALVIGVALIACSRQEPAPAPSKQAIVQSSETAATALVRDFDPEYGVACYRERYSDALACIKVSEPIKNSGNTTFNANTTEY